MTTADIIIVITVALLLGAIIFGKVKARKKSPCCGCPYAKSCTKETKAKEKALGTPQK